MMSDPTTDMMNSDPGLAHASSGIGLRGPHVDEILNQKPDIGFLEAHSENYFNTGGIPYRQLEKLRALYPLSLHGVGLSLGSADGVDQDHLQKLKRLIDSFEPALISEHLSWSRIENTSVPDLLPLPMTEEALEVLSRNIIQTQDFLKRSILIENPSAYMGFIEQDMSEPEFLVELCRRTDCNLLLDINNIHVSGHNLDFDTAAYLKNIPPHLVKEIHLAGYQINIVDGHEVLIDAHNNPVYDPVWDLYKSALKHLGDVPTLIEWDNDLPALERLVDEAKQADIYRKPYQAEALKNASA